MCDTIAGQLLVSFHDTDAAAQDLIESILRGNVPHVDVMDSLGERVTKTTGRPMRRGLHFSFYRLRVPVGQEAFKVGYLQFHYKHAVLHALHSGRLDPVKDADVLSMSNYHMQVVPHSWLSIRHANRSAIGFSFTPTHDDYKQLLGWTPSTSSSSASTKRVLVLDTGLDPASSCTVVDQTNFVDDTNPTDVTDDHGHGTAVTEVIYDLCPSAEFVVYKVADANGRASEWDTLAALAARSDADVANISLAFGLADGVCTVCGRESHSSRSAVFENMMNQLDQATEGPLLVAAAGNDALTELSFPARFDNVVAVASVNLATQLSQFTNRAAQDHEGNNHPNVFVLPGGERFQGSNPSEFIGTSSNGDEFYGTSFAAAYASGTIAALWSEPLHSGKDRQQLIDHLRNNAETSLPQYKSATHGNGLMQVK